MQKTIFAGLVISGLILFVGLNVQAHDKDKIKKVRPLFKQEQVLARGLTGKILTVATSTVELQIGKKKTVSVEVDANDIIVNRIWDRINFSDLKVGDRIQVFGNLSATTTVAAKFIRDLSLPALTANPN